MTRGILNISLSFFVITLAIIIWVGLFFAKSTLDHYLLMIEQGKQAQIEIIEKGKEIQEILFEAGFAAVIIALSEENIVPPTDAEKMISESIGKIGKHSERLGEMAKYINDYRIYRQTTKKPLSKDQTLDMGTKSLSFRNLEGSFIDSSTAGKLFVVTGLVTNNYPDKRSFIRLRSNILDSKGKIAKSKIVYAGNPISNNDLQTLSMEEINKRLLNRAGRNNINMNIPPNASIPFMFVIDNLPEDVSEFTVEAISSSPKRGS